MSADRAKELQRADQASNPVGNFVRIGHKLFSGFVADHADLVRKFTVDILVDGIVERVVRADRYVDALARKSVGDACYGFVVSLDDEMIESGEVVAARLSNFETPVGEPIPLRQTFSASNGSEGPGSFRWCCGLKFSGWIAENVDPALSEVRVDGHVVDRIRVDGWSHVGESENARAVRAFSIHLPNRFADGVVHQLTVAVGGLSLSGSPSPFLSFADSLRDLIAKQAPENDADWRAIFLDYVIPNSVPFSQYRKWANCFLAPTLPETSLGFNVISVGVGAAERTILSLQSQVHLNWSGIALAPVGADTVSFSRDEALAFLEDEGAAAKVTLFCLSGTVLAQNALTRVCHAFSSFEGVRAVYGDFDVEALGASPWPVALSAFDYERMLEQGYCAHLFALSTVEARRALERGADNLYRLFTAALSGDEPDKIVHLPGSLGILPELDPRASAGALAVAVKSHLQNRGVEAAVTQSVGQLLPAVHVQRRRAAAATTIVIPIRDRHQLLEECLDSIAAVTSARDVTVLIIDNESTDHATLKYLDAARSKRRDRAASSWCIQFRQAQ